MIFVTVGSSMAFDRLVHAVDEWAGLHGRTDVFAQIGQSDYHPKYIKVVRFMDPSEFRERVSSSSLVVAHAGMGSIITALEIGKPIVVMPRREHLGETRSDHQVATARHFEQQPNIIVAYDETELAAKIEQAERLPLADRALPEASLRLISTVRDFINTRRCRPHYVLGFIWRD
jgi:UDP-N-acetylglucosamine transferase subunit ALG13